MALKGAGGVREDERVNTENVLGHGDNWWQVTTQAGIKRAWKGGAVKKKTSSLIYSVMHGTCGTKQHQATKHGTNMKWRIRPGALT